MRKIAQYAKNRPICEKSPNLVTLTLICDNVVRFDSTIASIVAVL
jgi:hypothetical protein